jgi:hypothetical protein
MYLGHYRKRGDVPGWGGLFHTRDRFLHMAAFTLRVIGLDVGIVRSVIRNIHRSAAPRLGTAQMFVLERLHKPAMRYPLLF